MNLTKWLFEKTRNNEKTAVSIKNEEISYKNLYEEVIRVTKSLSKIVGDNKNIILISDNSFFFVVSYLSIIGSGNVCVPLKYDDKLDLKKIKERIKSDVIFIQKQYLKILKHLNFTNVITEKVIEKSNSNFNYEFEDYGPDRLASIMFTSGTTGEPKGVIITHNNIIKNTESIIDGLYLKENDRIMVVLPFYYCFGASLLHTHLRVGGEIVLNNDFFLPQRIIDEMVHKKCTGIAGVPTTFQILLRRTKIKQMVFPEIRCIQQAGGKLANSYLKEMVDIFGYDKLFIMYGQTEATARLSILDPKYLKEKFGSVGKGIKGVQLKILDKNISPVKVGELGEIYAKGENIMLGYYNDEKETKKKIVNGMLKTRDIARIDEDGFIYIVNRESDFIKTRGYRVSSKLVEEILTEIPEVVEVAVLGVPDELFGEKIIAYISVNKEIDRNKIMNY